VPSESDLRDLLRDPDPKGRGAIDLDAVLTRARRRRRPRVIAAQALGSVALVGVLGTAVVVSLPRPAQEAALIAQDTSAGSEEATAPFADSDATGGSFKMVDGCGEELAITPSAEWSVSVLDADAVAGVISLRAQLTAVAADPSVEWTPGIGSLYLTRDDIVVGHAGPSGGGSAEIDDASGFTFVWDLDFEIAPCEGTVLPAGRYGLVAVAAVSIAGSESESEWIASAPVPIEIG